MRGRPRATTRRPDAGRRKLVSTELHVTGFVAAVSGLAMLVSVPIDVVTDNRASIELTVAGLAAVVVGWAIWSVTDARPLATPAAGFRAVTAAWVGLSLVGAAPYILADTFAHWDDALFESVSGYTATGATVMAPIEGVSRGLLFYRSLTQWVGGIGVIVLAVSILPYFGVGGLSLLAAEAPGPTTERLAPRVQNTARRLSAVYLLLTALVVVGMLAAGTSLYDATTHAFTAVSTGGFSQYDTSVAHFDSIWVELVLIAGMVGGAMSFVLHWRALTGKPRIYLQSSEAKLFALVLAASTLLITATLVEDDLGWHTALREAAFQVVSVMTTTGFATADFVQWAGAAQVILVLLMITGSMTGSTSGALKIFRFQLSAGMTRRLIRKSAHPHGVFVVRHDGRPVDEEVVDGAVALVLAYVAILVAGVCVLTVAGTAVDAAIGGVATSMGGVGPGLGAAGPAGNFLAYGRFSRGVLTALMLIGRLEVFPVLLSIGVLLGKANQARPHLSRHSSPSRVIAEVVASRAARRGDTTTGAPAPEGRTATVRRQAPLVNAPRSPQRRVRRRSR